MNELPRRTADPTLHALPGLTMLAFANLAGVPTAHRLDETEEVACGYGRDELLYWSYLPARLACWFAVPCREGCFDAPPPGQLRWHSDDGLCSGVGPDAGLAWQTEGRW